MAGLNFRVNSGFPSSPESPRATRISALKAAPRRITQDVFAAAAYADALEIEGTAAASESPDQRPTLAFITPLMTATRIQNGLDLPLPGATPRGDIVDRLGVSVVALIPEESLGIKTRVLVATCQTDGRAHLEHLLPYVSDDQRRKLLDALLRQTNLQR